MAKRNYKTNPISAHPARVPNEPIAHRTRATTRNYNSNPIRAVPPRYRTNPPQTPRLAAPLLPRQLADPLQEFRHLQIERRIPAVSRLVVEPGEANHIIIYSRRQPAGEFHRSEPRRLVITAAGQQVEHALVEHPCIGGRAPRPR